MSNPVAHVEILGCRVRIDADGRYSLNDLHRSAIANGKATESQRPGEFMKTAGVRGFVLALEETAKIVAVTSKPGRAGGTFADELVAVRYAAWIDPAFEVLVYQTFQNSRRNAADEVRRDMERAMSRQRARLEAPALTDAVKHSREAQGKAIAAHHFSNEFDLINRIALGQPAKSYRVANGIATDAPLRDYLTPRQILCVEHLQRLNASLIDIGMPFEERKARLSQVYIQRHSRPLLAEVKRMEF